MAAMFGVETEYAFAALDAAGRSLNRRASASRLLDLVGRRVAHLPDGSSSGMFLQNGARLYVDCGAHPEFSTPECTHPSEAVRYVAAGDRLLGAAAGELVAEDPEVAHVVLSRGNVDYSGTGSTWGCHESYLNLADPRNLARQIVPHLVSRIVFTGAGGFDNLCEGARFTLSPRVPHLTRTISGSSTHDRGIFHSKDEPLCGGDYHRLHVLCGESSCSQTAAWLKIGTTALVVAMVEAGLAPGDEVELRSPVAAMRVFAADPTCRARARTKQGAALSALAIQRRYLEQVEAQRGAPFLPKWADEVCERWRSVLDQLAEAPDSVALTLDWAIKLALFRSHAESRGVSWKSVGVWTGIASRLVRAIRRSGVASSEPATAELILGKESPIPDEVARLQPVLRRHGLSWDGLRPFLDLRKELFEIDACYPALGKRGIFAALESQGVLRHRVSSVEPIEPAMIEPPCDGRARVRGEAIRELARAGAPNALADWHAVWDRSGRRTLDLNDPFARAPRWEVWTEDDEPLSGIAFLRRSLGIAVRGRRRS